MNAFRLRLEQALGSGAALALLSVPACGGSATNTEPTAGPSGTAGSSAQQLTPYPVSGLGCSGEVHDGGYYGQCCADALCYTPEDGNACVAADSAPEELGKFYGSGACLCGAESLRGPFAPNPAHEPRKAGTCCYVISSITCDGRPLLVEGAPLVSALTQRRDWILADLLEVST